MKKDCILLIVLAVLLGGLWLLPSPRLIGREAGKLVRVKVLSVDNSDLQKHGLVLYGPQHLKLKLPDGSLRDGNNELRAQMELDKLFKPGDKAVAVYAETGTLNVKDHYRTHWIFILVGAFSLFLLLFGGWTGFKALASFVVSCVVVWKGLIPLILLGWGSSLACFLCTFFLTAAIIFAVAGFNRKGVAAFSGSMAGVFCSLLLAHLFTILMNLNGAVMPYSQALYYSGYEFLNLRDLFAGALILGCSGAVMDLAMDIAAGVEEIHLHCPELPAKELMRSGFRIGRSVTGTMTTTLLLAYSGGYITLLMMFFAQGTPPLEFINNPLVASEIAKTLIGSFGLVLVAPFTAIFAAWLFRKNKK